MIKQRTFIRDSENDAVKSAVDSGAKIYFLTLANCIAFGMISFMLGYVYRDYTLAISVLLLSVSNLYVFIKR